MKQSDRDRLKEQVLKLKEGANRIFEDILIELLAEYRRCPSEKRLQNIRGILKGFSRKLDRGYICDRARDLGLEELWQAIQSGEPGPQAPGAGGAPSAGSPEARPHASE